MDKKIFNEEIISNMSKLVLEELREDPFYKFKLVFALMGVIPLLTLFYIILGSGIDITKISFVLYVLIFISILGFVLGYNTIKVLLGKIIFYAIEIKRSEQIKAELVASISHDFKTPILIIKELLGLLASGSSGTVNQEQKIRLSSCQSTLDNMSHTIETLLDLYKIEAGMVSLKKEKTDLSAVLLEKINEFEVLFNKENITVTKRIPEGILLALVDRDKIKEVIGNLLSNSLKYIPKSGWLSIYAFTSGEFVRIEFANNSDNIPIDKLGLIFEKFKRLDNEKEGTGLGLAIAKDIVELHGGDIWAENVKNNEVKFIVALPRVKN